MSDEMKSIFTAEEVAEQAQGNANALAFAAIAYLRDHQLDVDEYWTFVGQQFAPGWASMQGRTTKEIAQVAALNMVSVGGTLQSLLGDESQAEVVILGWPPEDPLTFFGLDQADADTIWNIFRPIAEYLGLRYAWQRQGDEVTMTFSHRSNE